MANTITRHSRATMVTGLIVAAGILLLVLANIHLVYVAITSQPACVPHLERGEGASGNGSFTAATSAC